MLSTRDRQLIEELYSRYCWANDAGDLQTWVDTFLESGVYDFNGQVFEGRKAIRTLFGERIAARPGQPIEDPQHIISNLIVDGDAKGARGRCYFMRAVRARGTGVISIETAGWFSDELRKVGGQWYFARRRVSRHIYG